MALRMTRLGRARCRWRSELDAVPALVAALEDSEADVRGRAAAALGAIGSTGCVDALVRLTNDPETWVQTAAMRSLAQLRAIELLEPAEAALGSPHVWLRASAVESLGILGEEEGLSLVLRALTTRTRT